jgi:hypothetical protein
MYYTRRYQLKTGEITTEGSFDTKEESEELCEKLIDIENLNENSRSIFITEQTEEPERTIDQAIDDVVFQMAMDMQIPLEHIEQVNALFRENL